MKKTAVKINLRRATLLQKKLLWVLPAVVMVVLTGSNPVMAQQDSTGTIGSIIRLDTKLDELIPSDASVEILAHGFGWSEGPVWIPESGHLLFSDIPANTIYKWHPENGLSLFLRPAAYAIGKTPLEGREAGSNGLFLNPVTKKLVICEHGNRCISELDQSKWYKTILFDEFEGKKFNSPNDVVISSKGHYYFTDPPFGLSKVDGKQENNPLKELDFNGVFHVNAEGKMEVVTEQMTRPNGIGLSPDEKKLYVANADWRQSYWMVFDVQEDGTPTNGRKFFDATDMKKSGKLGSCDGMAIDAHGNIWATGPGGVLIFTPEGKHIGSIEVGERIANCTFGGPEGNELYMTADMYLLRLKVKVKGMGY